MPSKVLTDTDLVGLSALNLKSKRESDGRAGSNLVRAYSINLIHKGLGLVFIYNTNEGASTTQVSAACSRPAKPDTAALLGGLGLDGEWKCFLGTAPYQNPFSLIGTPRPTSIFYPDSWRSSRMWLHLSALAKGGAYAQCIFPLD